VEPEKKDKPGNDHTSSEKDYRQSRHRALALVLNEIDSSSTLNQIETMDTSKSYPAGVQAHA